MTAVGLRVHVYTGVFSRFAFGRVDPTVSLVADHEDDDEDEDGGHDDAADDDDHGAAQELAGDEAALPRLGARVELNAAHHARGR